MLEAEKNHEIKLNTLEQEAKLKLKKSRRRSNFGL